MPPPRATCAVTNDAPWVATAAWRTHTSSARFSSEAPDQKGSACAGHPKSKGLRISFQAHAPYTLCM